MTTSSSSLTLLMMAGPPGSGKTTLALALGRELSWPVVDKDTLKSSMLGAGVDESVAGPASYDLMFAFARDILTRQGLSVILDSPAGYVEAVERARALSDEARANLKWVLCLTPQRRREQRIASRETMPSQWQVDQDDLGDGRERWDPLLPSSRLAVDTVASVDDLLPEVINYLRRI